MMRTRQQEEEERRPMRPDTMPSDLADHLLAPAYWLVAATEWPDDPGPAEAAWAVAPALIPRDAISPHAYQVLGCADQYAAGNAARIVLFSDLTRLFTTAGTSWASLGVDWQAALDELRYGPYPAVLLAVNDRAHALICDPTAELLQLGQDSEPDWAWHDRELLRQSIANQLTVGWPAYITNIIELGKLHIAN
jgi:hypothetical protein